MERKYLRQSVLMKLQLVENVSQEGIRQLLEYLILMDVLFAHQEHIQMDMAGPMRVIVCHVNPISINLGQEKHLVLIANAMKNQTAVQLSV